MVMSKAYEYYEACINDGASRKTAIEQAAHVWDVDAADLEKYADHWDSMK